MQAHTILSQRPLGLKRCTLTPMRTLLQEFACSGCVSLDLTPDELAAFLRAVPVELLLDALGASGVVYPVRCHCGHTLHSPGPCLDCHCEEGADNPFLGLDEAHWRPTHAHDEDGAALCRYSSGNDHVTNLEELVTCQKCTQVLDDLDARAELRRLTAREEC